MTGVWCCLRLSGNRTLWCSYDRCLMLSEVVWESDIMITTVIHGSDHRESGKMWGSLLYADSAYLNPSFHTRVVSSLLFLGVSKKWISAYWSNLEVLWLWNWGHSCKASLLKSVWMSIILFILEYLAFS